MGILTVNSPIILRNLSAALDRIRINLNSVEENVTFNARIFCPCTAWRGSVSMYILTLWFLPSFAHYFMNLTTALDSTRYQFWTVLEENVTFNVHYFMKFHARLGVVRMQCCCPRMGMVLDHLSPIILRNLSAALDSIRINLNSVEENLTFNALFCPCTACCPGLGMVPCMHILTEWFLPSCAHYFMKPYSSFGQQK